MAFKVGDAIAALDSVFPLATQDGWDNSGLLVGDAEAELTGILLTVDITEDAVAEAIEKGLNLIISHHPLMFRGLKRLTGGTAEQRIVANALRGGIALAAFHTPADKQIEGTSGTLGNMLGLLNMQVLVPEADSLSKIVVYVPTANAETIVDAMSDAGAGHIGNYSHCAWKTDGDGQFRAEDGAHPYVGDMGEIHHEAESRVEAICPKRLVGRVVRAVVNAHPYEEPAIDIIPLDNKNERLGYGVVGDMANDVSVSEFLTLLKEKTGCGAIRYAGRKDKVRRVAICTGSGSEFVPAAIRSGADAYVTADMKYHQMADAAEEIMVADVGHYESESLTKQIFKGILSRKLSNFARCEIYKDANPIKYY